MEADLLVDVEQLRRHGSGVTRTAHRVAAGANQASALTVPAKGWSTGRALAHLAQVSTDSIGVLGERIAATGDRLWVAADGYERADDRAAGRLRAGAA